MLLPIMISPPSGLSNPAIHLKVVLLPHPLGPEGKELTRCDFESTPDTAFTSPVRDEFLEELFYFDHV